jgi:hypothetical protein
VCAAVLVGALGGCGSSGAGTTGGGAAETGATTARHGEPGKQPHTMVGVRGESRGSEAATNQHISPTDCRRLRHEAEAQAQIRLHLDSEPTPPNSRCRLTGPGTTIGVYLDSGRSAHQRYQNRMVEQNQFSGADPGRVIHPVPRVGEPGYGDENASWVPDISTLFAARGNRWLTVTYMVAGVTGPVARTRAAALAILGFRLTSH